MRLLVLLLLLLPTLAHARDDVDSWDLSDLFPSLEAWSQAKTQLEADAERFADCEDRVTASQKDLAECVERYFALQQAMTRVWVYASAGAATDNRDADANARRGDVGMLFSQLQETTAFVEPALVAAGEATLSKYIKREKRLKPYAHFLRRTLRMADHTLDADGEALLASASPMMRAPFSIFQMLTDADLDWPEVTLSDGTEITVNKAAYNRHRASANRADRQLVFDAFYGAVGGVQRTLGASLNAHLAADNFEARARGYESTVEAALFENGIPPAVYSTLVEQANAHLPTLHRYLKLRARMLGVDAPTYVDIYPPLVDLEREFPLSVGKELTIASAAPLGKDYVSVLSEGLAARWMDAYPKDGKSAGAFATGAYGVHPYVLMNYQDEYGSVATLAHEWGHAMHSHLASEAQPFASADYDAFMAEVASTFNEALLLDYMLKEAKSDEERLYYLGSALEGLRGTFFRQAMFAEFERTIHERVEGGEALTGERLSEAYLELLRRFHGHDAGVMAIDEQFASEWAWIPHFYFGYYVFQYATSISAASLLSRRVLDGEKGAVDAYLDLLRAGSSGFSYELLKDAGVDLATAAPYEAIVARMNAIMDEMEGLLAKVE